MDRLLGGSGYITRIFFFFFIIIPSISLVNDCDGLSTSVSILDNQ